MDESILEALYKSVLKFLEPLTPEETYATIVKEASKLVNAEYGSIFLARNHVLERVYASSEHLKVYKIRKDGYHSQVFKSKKPVVLNVEEVTKVHPIIKKSGIKSTIIIPLSYKNQTLGVLSVDSLKKERFSEKDLHILILFGSMASLAIRKTQLYDEAKKALDMRNQFISLAAHELRTPLTSIHGYLQLLNKKYNKSSTESRWISDMYGESLKLTNLVNELLEVNHIETGKQLYNFEICNFVEIVNKAVDRLITAYPNHSLEFEKNQLDEAIVIADPYKLLQMVFSLLDNAAKFSTDKKLIEIKLYEKADDFIMYIIDYGRGIKKEDLPHIFEGFYKANNNIVGMGVGLLLSKEIVKRHHGSMVISSKPGKGTTVKLKLPKAHL